MNSYTKQEWFTAFELEGMGDLPNKATNITRRATKENWEKRQVQGKKGIAYEYHYSSLPLNVQKQLGFNAEELYQKHMVEEPTATYGLPQDLVNVPFYKTFASAGFGALNDDVYTPDDFIGLSPQWLFQRGLQKNKLAFILTSGDSMTPTIHHGDMLLVNRAATTPRDGQIYIIRSGDQLWVKRVQGIPGGIRLISDNKDIYAPIELMFEDNFNFEVLGQVVFIGHDLI